MPIVVDQGTKRACLTEPVVTPLVLSGGYSDVVILFVFLLLKLSLKVLVRDFPGGPGVKDLFCTF